MKTFSATGGIEKVCRVAGKALYEISDESGGTFSLMSMHDKQGDMADSQYFPVTNFRGFGGAKIKFMLHSVRFGAKHDIVIISHINLLPAAWLIKKISPSTRIILIAHGIEIWGPLGKFRERMLQTCDRILSVSNYTNQQIQKVHNLSASKCVVINNCLDPFLPPVGRIKKEALMQRYGLDENDIVLFAITRLAVTERHKGYDKVIRAIAEIQKTSTARICYLLAGKYTAEEKEFIGSVAATAGIKEQVILAGFIGDDELADHYCLADIYIMPSKKEGFGIVFIEALHYGLPVIAGNKDGSVDALGNGMFGINTDPDDPDAILASLSEMIQNRDQYKPDINLVNQKFGFDSYKSNLKKLTGELLNNNHG